MSERPHTPEIDTDRPEQAFGPKFTATRTDLCPICQFSYTLDRTPVVRTTWGRTVHPACLAPAVPTTHRSKHR